MIFQKHTVNSRRTLSNVSLFNRGTTFPLGLTLDKYLDFISDVKQFKASINSSIIPINEFEASSNVNDLLSQIAGSQLNQPIISSIVGPSIRQIIPIGKINPDFSDITTFAGWPTSLTEYPYFECDGFGGGRLIVDCGKTIFSNGLLFPFITIELSSDVGSTSSGLFIGFVIIISQFVHGKEHASVHGLQAIANVG